MKRFFSWLICLAVVAGSIVWGNFSIDTDREEIALVRLSREFDGFRLIHISDLHGREFGAHNAALLQAVAEAKPDLICITGDLFDESTGTAFLPPLLEGLVEIAPVYYVTGNHEWQVETLRMTLRSMEDMGVTVLHNEYHLLRRGGSTLVVAGVDDPCGPLDQKSPTQLMDEIHTDVGQNVPVLMLDHRNDRLALWAELGADLVLSGHCHGGVVRLPLVGGVLGTHRELFPSWDAGLYRKAHTALFVSRGLGYSHVRFRLFNRPHLPLLILRCPNS